MTRSHLHPARTAAGPVTAAVTAVLFLFAHSGTAADLSQTGIEANILGKNYSEDSRSAQPSFRNKEISFTVDGSTLTIHQDDLAPDGTEANIRYLRSSDDFVNQRGRFRNDDELREASAEQKNAVQSATASGDSTIEAEVYSVLVDLAEKQREDHSTADYLKQSADTFAAVDALTNDLVDCDAENSVSKTTETVRLPNLKQCHQVMTLSSSCVITHSYSASASGITDGGWTPASCISTANAVKDGFAAGTVTCIDTGGTVTGSGCVQSGGVTVCESDLGSSPISGIGATCRKVQVQSSSNFSQSTAGCRQVMTGYEADGRPIYQTVCDEAGGSADTCAEYSSNPNCRLVTSTCTKGAGGTSGTCYVNDVTYDCGEDVVIEKVQADSSYSCVNAACTGEACMDVDRTYSTEFGRLSTLLSVAQNLSLDVVCNGLTASGTPSSDLNQTCHLFEGSSHACRTSVGGSMDCCASLPGPSSGEYVKMILEAQRLRSAVLSVRGASSRRLTSAQSTEGALHYVPLAAEIAGQYGDTQGIVPDLIVKSGVGFLKKHFSSPADNVYGQIDYLSSSVTTFKDWAEEEISSYLNLLFHNILEGAGYGGSGIQLASGADRAARNASASAVADLDAGTASVLDTVNAVFVAYQTANLVFNGDAKCLRSEYETVAKRDTGNCHYVGSYCENGDSGPCASREQVYCCYDSPLSRIMAEHLKDYYSSRYGSAYGWGTPEHPRCGGYTLPQVERLNWGSLNFGEWTAMVAKATGMTGGGSSSYAASSSGRLSSDKLTGSSSSLNWTGVREAVAERASKKLENQQVDGIRVAAQKCITLDIGNGITLREGCSAGFDGELMCTFKGNLVPCEDLAYRNSLEGLLEHEINSKIYWDEGYRCTEGSIDIDCSSLYSQEAYWRALEEYARILGGSTLIHRYVCVDETGSFRSSVCENAMIQNYCSCAPGRYTCRDGNRIIACETLGATFNRCQCMDGVCEAECTYGGIPKGLEDNTEHVCTEATCNYGRKVDGYADCDAKTCPYG